MKELRADNSYYDINGQKVFLVCNQEYATAKAFPYLAYPWLMELDLHSFVSAHPIAHCPIAVTETLVESGRCLSTRCRSCIWREDYTVILHNWLDREAADIPLQRTRCGLWANLGDSLQAGGFSPDCIGYRTDPVPPLQTGEDRWLSEKVKDKLTRGRARFIAGQMACPDEPQLIPILAKESVIYLLETDKVFESPEAYRGIEWHIRRWRKIPCQDPSQAASMLLNGLGSCDTGDPMIFCPEADLLIAVGMEGEGSSVGCYLVE